MVTRHCCRLVISLALLVLVLPGPISVLAEPQVSIDETNDPGTYRVVARDFKDGEDVSTWFTGPNQEVMAGTTYTTNDHGRVEFLWEMPRYAHPGRWAITVYGLKSNDQVIEYFDVPDLGMNAELTADTPTGPAGSDFAFSGRGFDAKELVSYWLTSPDGIAYPGGTAESASDGTVHFSYPIGAESKRGVWQMSAAGSRSNTYAVTSFTVT